MKEGAGYPNILIPFFLRDISYIVVLSCIVHSVCRFVSNARTYVSSSRSTCVDVLPPSLSWLWFLLVHDIGKKFKSQVRSGSKWFQVVQNAEDKKG